MGANAAPRDQRMSPQLIAEVIRIKVRQMVICTLKDLRTLLNKTITIEQKCKHK